MRRIQIIAAVCLLASLCLIPALTHAQASSGAAKSSAASSAKTDSAKAPSDAEIAAAKAAGKVWVNLTSGVYHKSGRWYGKTKNGKFMSEDEAKKAGYKPAHRD